VLTVRPADLPAPPRQPLQKVVDMQWCPADPWTIMSVSDDTAEEGEEEGGGRGGGTLQVGVKRGGGGGGGGGGGQAGGVFF
jgi:hypothetical protein